MWCLMCLTSTSFSVCAASVPHAHTVEEFPRGPWIVVTFRHLFVKVNNIYVRFIEMSLPQFGESNNVFCKVYGLST